MVLVKLFKSIFADKNIDIIKAVNDLSGNMREWSEQFKEFSILNGHVLKYKDSNGKQTTEIPLSTTAKVIPHGLGRVPTGWIIIKKNANAVIYDDSTGVDIDKKSFIRLTASASVTVSIWVF